jgi:hypothetical protein
MDASTSSCVNKNNIVDRPNFEPPAYSVELFSAPNDKYKLLLNVSNFNGYVRVGVTKKFWCDEKNQFLFAPKGHCFFPIEVCDALIKYLPVAKAEAERLERSIEKPLNEYASAAGRRYVYNGEPYINRLGNAQLGIAQQLGNAQYGRLVEKPRGRFGDVATSIFASTCARGGKACGAARGRPCGSKSRTAEIEYKTDEVQEEKAPIVEQAPPAKKRKVVSDAQVQTSAV